MDSNDFDLGRDLTELEGSSLDGLDERPLEARSAPPSHPTSARSDSGTASSFRDLICKPRPETVYLGRREDTITMPPTLDLERSWHRPEGDGVSDFLIEHRKNYEADRRAEAGYGFPTSSVKAFMYGGPREPDWVIPGLVPRKEVCIFAAEAGIGKTTLLTQMLLSVASGQPFFGLPVGSGVVVGLFHEDSSAHLRGRLGTLFEETSTDLDRLDESGNLLFETRDYDPGAEDRRVLWDKGPTPNFFDLERKIEAVGGVRLLVIDTIKRVIAGDVDKGENVRHFLSALQGLADRQNIAIVASTHVNNHGKTAGSSEFVNQGRSVFHLIRSPKNGTQATLTSIKLNCGPEPSPILLEKTLSGFWRVRSTTVEPTARANALIDARERGERLRAILFDVIDNHPKKLSVHKQAESYAPRFAAGTSEAEGLGASPAEFEAVMADALLKGEIEEVRKDTRHSTKVLRVVDRGV
ncbi:AAA family ATPase [Lichenibacterium dinghuense]|uniref:AAA family ATPase n=1 Tax=Lichenibacterium dinghuense TaxID=2895977 RepID=UPI001F241881|nr:AAA family ATPase [Lichenibacterium sp. 6Y81]